MCLSFLTKNNNRLNYNAHRTIIDLTIMLILILVPYINTICTRYSINSMGLHHILRILISL